MAQSHMMNNQHAMMPSNPTIVASGSNGQTRVNSQGLLSTKSMYQPQSPQVNHLAHLQQQQHQSHILNSSHNQKSQSDIPHQYNSNMNNVPTQIGNGNSYQNVAGNSLHFDIGFDSSQINMHQPEPSSTSHQYQQPNQASVQMQQQTQQHYSSMSLTQQHVQQPLQHQQNNQQYFVAHGSQHHQNQSSQGSKKMVQPQSQIQQLQQRSYRYQKLKQQQPKQILQNVNAINHGSLPLKKEQSSLQPDSLPIANKANDKPCIGDKISDSSGDEGDVHKEDSAEKSSEKTSNASENSSLANTKEKTPMCLINELARFNKTEHQYTLVDEQGPAHKKTFYVKLKLGEEEYSTSGESIKKAQHAAAAIALNETKYKHPPPKPARPVGDNSENNITPTVELNALAMKRGEAVIYKSIEPQQPPYHQTGLEYRGFCNQRYHQFMRSNRDPRYQRYWPIRYQYTRTSRAFYVSLRVGPREFIGDGQTRQSARHNAAQKALKLLRPMPLDDSTKPLNEQIEDVSSGDDLKSEISLVHELALRRNMVVTFEVIRETGPAHMKNFLTRCTVSDMVTEGEGNSKKISKKKAAELMLDELKKLSPLPAVTYIRPKSKIQLNKKKNRNIIKSEIQQQKADPNYGVGINPISRLIQIMQAQKKKEPVYTLVAERGMPRRREFTMQVEVEGKNCTGSGPNKKLAKRAAAEAMLQSLGYTKPSPQPAKSSFKHSSEGGSSNGDKKVTFVDASQSDGEKSPGSSASSVSHQRVPGILHLPSKMMISTTANSNSTPSPGIINLSATSSPWLVNLTTNKESQVDLSAILKPNWRPEQQLVELCKVFDYKIEIDDFAKKKLNSTEYISRISIGVENPKNPQNFHGSSNTVESARDMAALDALKLLVPRVKDIHPGGDGPQVKKLTRTIVGVKQDATQK